MVGLQRNLLLSTTDDEAKIGLVTNMDFKDFQALADLRINEAAALLALTPPLPNGAYYLAGYSVECALKACIAKKFGQYVWPNREFVQKCYTHDLNKLLECANLTTLREDEGKKDSNFAQSWIIVKDWSEQSRYKMYSFHDAEQIVKAVQEPTHGVLRWIKQYW
jgi:hypothetical protein